jgi:cell wall-associated NlpC family hydrolase
MATLSPEEIYRVALQAGFPPDRAEIFTAIALAESRGNTEANAAGSEDSRGLWQINVSPGVRENTWGDLSDPLTNARAAYEISGGGMNLRPWSVTHQKHAGTQQDYRSWSDEARAAAAAVGATPAGSTATGAVDTFVESALAQVGDPYVWNANAVFSDPDPDSFDCSELVEWAAHRAGVKISDGTWLQYLELQEADALTTVDHAIQTRGALLFHFSQAPTPGGGRPSQAHVAISLGDGRIVEAAGDEVQISRADPDRFNYAAVIPGLAAASPPPATAPAAASDDVPAAPAYSMAAAALPSPRDEDSDGLTDHFETLLGTALDDGDTDDDGLGDFAEATEWQTNPQSDDTDGDGVADGVEAADGSDPGRYRLPDEVVAAGFGGAAWADVDDDGRSDLAEVRDGTDRDEQDTDFDGIDDGLECAFGSNPNSIDSNNDGLTDGHALGLGMLGPESPSALEPGVPDEADSAGDGLLPV